ncbi:MAG: response regulator, partial [Pseudobdellovibrionaceae bacterium]
MSLYLVDEFKSFLVVDDSIDNCDLIEAYLRKPNLELTFAHSANEAFEKFKQGPFDALLLDYELPDAKGPDLLHQFRAWESEQGFSNTPCFLISGHDSVPDAHFYAAHIRKPFSRAQMIETINKWYKQTRRDGGLGASMETNIQPGSSKYIVKVERDLEDLIPNFVANRKKDVRLLGEWIQTQNYEEIRRLGHTLKGVCASYGFP